MVAHRKAQDVNQIAADDQKTRNERRARKAESIYLIEVDQSNQTSTQSLFGPVDIQPVSLFTPKDRQ